MKHIIPTDIDIKMPEINYVVIAGNLTKDPSFRQTSNGTSVCNFSIACNRRFKDSNNVWQEEVCYIGIVTWSRLAENCHEKLKKGYAIIAEGELQSRVFRTEKGDTRSILEVKARRIQFLNKNISQHDDPAAAEHTAIEEDSFEKHLSPEDSALLEGEQKKDTES